MNPAPTDNVARRGAASQGPAAGEIELNLQDINQLFNTMDPSPFHQKDLDHDAEEFILSWAQEFPRNEPLKLTIHLQNLPARENVAGVAAEGVHNYFAYRARLNRMELKRLFKQGRAALFVGLGFLGACLLIIELLLLNRPTGLPNFLTQSLTIAGWVAMWRPMEIYLYEWWPIRARGRIFEKLSRIPIQVRQGSQV